MIYPDHIVQVLKFEDIGHTFVVKVSTIWHLFNPMYHTLTYSMTITGFTNFTVYNDHFIRTALNAV